MHKFAPSVSYSRALLNPSRYVILVNTTKGRRSFHTTNPQFKVIMGIELYILSGVRRVLATDDQGVCES